MSTRCQIAFYRDQKVAVGESEAMIYRHSDGYPGDPENPEEPGVLQDIVPFLKDWKERRGLDDGEYAAARLLQHMCNEHDESMRKLHAELEREVDPRAGIIGYGVTRHIHGDIDYFYRVYPDAVEVYKTRAEVLEKGEILEEGQKPIITVEI